MALSELIDPAKKVLVADDVKSARVGLRAQLMMLGFTEVVEADDGDQAWALLEQHDDFQLIVLDWSMPGPDGAALAEKIQKEERLKFVPVIMATQRSEWESMAEATCAGVWAISAKMCGCSRARCATT